MKHKALTAAFAVAGATTIGLGASYARRSDETPEIVSAVVSRQSIVSTITASGTLEAVSMVSVGTQVSGSVLSLHADFNSVVRKGQVIARLEPSLYESAIEQAGANLEKAEADLERLRVAAADAETKRDRTRALWERQLVSANDMDAADVAVNSARAQVRSADAQKTQAAANLTQARVNLAKTVILAPIDGIVVARNVDVGQTVAASLQAPTLFVIAADLSQMQLKASIDEADVGRIAQGQNVSFTVDAYPGESFRGTVRQVRLNPTVEQNVVTYAAIITAPNAGLKLRPGMTASATAEVARRDNVLTVPSAALRLRPGSNTLSILEGTSMRTVSVKTGISDATSTEIADGAIQEGARVVTRIGSAQSARSTTSSPATRSPLMAGPPVPPPR